MVSCYRDASDTHSDDINLNADCTTDYVFLGQLHEDADSSCDSNSVSVPDEPAWVVSVKVGGTLGTFKVESGAEVTMMSFSDSKRLQTFQVCPLQRLNIKAPGYCQMSGSVYYYIVLTRSA
ncbi:unnamed protein product [Owenia fusiformis]|uniref:Uncharacterized protein n=1 Tax=Owenia fusiformis TaxID=6347 RepID=A0A8S4PXA2_OWEFU|nr:unnamed protein product [Owenia fusiformis]